MASAALQACSPFRGLTAETEGAEVSVADRDGVGIATIQARRGRRDDLAATIRRIYNVDLPQGPYRTRCEALAIAGTGPNTWLATCEDGCEKIATMLREAVGDAAAVVDQSGGLAVLRLGGPRIRDVLAKGVTIDLHEREFKIGAVAVTAIAHIGTTIWRIEDSPDGSPAFEVLMFRSMALSFWHWLETSSAEFGLKVLPHDLGSEK